MTAPVASSSRRLTLLGAIYVVGLVVILAQLFHLMVVRHEDWLVRSYQNRWAFRDVPSVRGALLDRHGRVVAEDEPTFELSCVYEHFRVYHPVGAALHAATLASRAAGTERRYSYQSRGIGPDQAFLDLLDLPVTLLFDSVLGKAERAQMVRGVLVSLSACSDRTPARVGKALRESLAQKPGVVVGDAMAGVPREQLTDRFTGVLHRLRLLDESLLALRQEQLTGRSDVAVDAVSLLQRLDGFRVDSFEERRTIWTAEDGGQREGELLERIARPVLRKLPFDLAAALRVASRDQPGLRLQPSLQRTWPEQLPPTLRSLLGGVGELGLSVGAKDHVAERVDEARDAGLDNLVPDDLLPTDAYRLALRRQAERSYARVLRLRERRGKGGIESMLDDQLAGSPGMRLVERDARSREQLLWSSLRVTPGQSVRLSVDLELQSLLDRQCEDACRTWQRQVDRPDLIDVAMAVVDARTGDVLALASAPAAVDGEPRIPAVLSWRGNGAVGSIVKPLFALEQLTSERQGLVHSPLADFEECAMTFRRQGRTYRCDHAHWQEGRDLVAAIGKSCNVFFFQVAEGLGPTGLRRGLYRFGLSAPDYGDGDGRYQARPEELPAPLAPGPRYDGKAALDRGIGYGIEASPLAMARAYAALATGQLPTLGLTRTERRVRPLGCDPEDLALVQDGLLFCVERGTARQIEGLAGFGVRGKTGTAEISRQGRNNAWFAGYLPEASADGVQLAFCAVVYAVPDGVHGAEAGGQLVADVLQRIAVDPKLNDRYLPASSAGGRGR
jgi:cell division protein FtsI/penicillin-binding protein 2